MTTQNCDLLLLRIRGQLEASTRIRSLAGGSCVLQTPFSDQSGDPINIMLYWENDTFTIEDAGIIAGHLFSLGQHTQDTPAHKLLNALANAYNLQVDFNQGTVKSVVAEHELVDAVMDLTKVIVTVLTATPHMRVRAQRIGRFGPRVRAKIKAQYKEKGILDLVETHYEIPGTVVEVWPIDFYWQLRRDSQIQDVYVLGVDLDVAEPLKKVGHITALAVDVKTSIKENSLRIVMDSHGKNSDALVAAKFLQQHKHVLGYSLFDFGIESERTLFLDRSVNEILGEQTQEWRELWHSRLRRTR